MTETINLPLETSAATLYQTVGLLSDEANIPMHLQLFVEQSEAVLQKVRIMIAKDELPRERGAEFQQLLVDICVHVMCHPIVASNNYLDRFADGITEAQAQHECQQFSVFALQFDVAQAKLVANAPTEEAYTERLQVLLNEKGIPFADGFEGELTGNWTNGTVHFNWMLNMAKGLGLGFEEIGKIWIAKAGTKEFVDATYNLYGSIDPNIASGAAFAIENWGCEQFMETVDCRDGKFEYQSRTYRQQKERQYRILKISRTRRDAPLTSNAGRTAGKLYRRLVRPNTVSQRRQTNAH